MKQPKHIGNPAYEDLKLFCLRSYDNSAEWYWVHMYKYLQEFSTAIQHLYKLSSVALLALNSSKYAESLMDFL